MVDRISAGRSAGALPADDRVSGKGGSARKGGFFAKRRAERENVAQTRQSGKGTGKVASKVIRRPTAPPPSPPGAPVDDSRQARRTRLQQGGAKLAQHKQDHTSARVSQEADKAQTLQQRERVGSIPGKEQVEIEGAVLDKYGMRDKLKLLNEMSDHLAAGRSVKIKEPPPLVLRKAALREGQQGLAGRLGTKIKDVLMRIFRPRQWRARQVELNLVRKDELRAAEIHAKKVLAVGIQEQRVERDRSEMIAGRSRAVNLRDDSVEEVSPVEKQDVKRVYTVAYDERIQQDPQYKAEKVVLDKGVAVLREEMETEAKKHINEVLDREQAIETKTSSTQQEEKQDMINDPRQTSL